MPLLIDKTKKVEDLYQPHKEGLKIPISKGKVARKNKGYDYEVRRARYLKNKNKKEIILREEK
jgi:hypothetical protein